MSKPNTPTAFGGMSRPAIQRLGGYFFAQTVRGIGELPL